MGVEETDSTEMEVVKVADEDDEGRSNTSSNNSKNGNIATKDRSHEIELMTQKIGQKRFVEMQGERHLHFPHRVYLFKKENHFPKAT